MTHTEIPERLIYRGCEYQLSIEKNLDTITLTYENDPVREDSFLIATFANDMPTAIARMKRLLTIEKLA